MSCQVDGGTILFPWALKLQYNPEKKGKCVIGCASF